MCFVVDEMLGKLARWLRVSGFDVTYQRDIPDWKLVRQARKEGRIILTRDTKLVQRLEDEEHLFIEHDLLEDQIRQFYRRFPELKQEQAPLTRCLECNTPLEAVDKNSVEGRVWPYVYETQEHFTTCPDCGRIYWQATHVDRMKEKLEDLLKP